MLSFTNIINTSALSYQSSVGVGFTFNPTLSVNISSSDLVISNLAPGTTNDSNTINVSVATNAAYGYTLSTIMNGDNNDLTHANGTNIFSSIATNADLSSLDNSEDTNIWGYSYKDNTVVSPTWSNYNGLSSSNSATLLDANTNNTGTGIDSIDFKIAAKAASTQASGTYTGVINFTAVTKLTPMNLAESYFAAGKTRHNGYYAMQDMTSEICNNTEVIGEGSQTELIDLRDNKVYWATKLADGHCWMTQNLDLDLDSNRTYTHWDTDLGWTVMDENATWKPDRSTIAFTIGSTISGWQSSNTEPYSANPGDVYFYTSNSDVNDIQYNSLQECVNAGHNDCMHYHVGNYYNWSAVAASSNTSGIASGYILNSVCPKSWRLPIGTSREFGNLFKSYAIIQVNSLESYSTNGLNIIRSAPLYFIRANSVRDDSLVLPAGRSALYWTRDSLNNENARSMTFYISAIYPLDTNGRDRGGTVRCLAR